MSLALFGSLIYVLLGIVGFFALVVLFLVFWLIGGYNGLVAGRNKTKEAWAQIDVQLKRRYDLIPNLIETVKGYVKHEKELLEGIARARAGLISGNPREAAQADAQLSTGLRQLYAVSEAYPDLKANQSFMKLHDDLSQTENAIAYARQGYNAAVLHYNNLTEMLPTNLIAGAMQFKAVEFFKVESEEQREAVKVKF